MIISIRRGQTPRVPTIADGAEPGPRFARWEGGLRHIGKAAVALTAAAVVLLGLVQVPGGPAIGAEAASSPQTPAAATQP